MPALSKKQQKFFGIVRAIQKGEQTPTTPETAKAAADMKKSDVKKFASTKHKGLPEKKKVEEMYNDQGNGKEQKQIAITSKHWRSHPRPPTARVRCSSRSDTASRAPSRTSRPTASSTSR